MKKYLINSLFLVGGIMFGYVLHQDVQNNKELMFDKPINLRKNVDNSIDLTPHLITYQGNQTKLSDCPEDRPVDTWMITMNDGQVMIVCTSDK